jgi:hypothetical protein
VFRGTGPTKVIAELRAEETSVGHFCQFLYCSLYRLLQYLYSACFLLSIKKISPSRQAVIVFKAPRKY